MSCPPQPAVLSFAVRTASGAIADIMVRPGLVTSAAELEELRTGIEADLPEGWTLVTTEPA